MRDFVTSTARTAAALTFVLAPCSLCMAQGTEATEMTFVGTATGNGTTVGNVPWSFTGTATQSFTKKSGGGSTGGGFSARNGGSWFAQSNGSLFYSIEDDGIHFGSSLHIAGNMPESLVSTGSVSTMVSGSFTFTTDEVLFYPGTHDWSGTFFYFASAHALAYPGLLFPGTHRVELISRTLSSGPEERVFDRTESRAHHIPLVRLPDGFASHPGRVSGKFQNSQLYLARNGSAALVAAPVSDPWSSSYPDDCFFVWKQDARANSVGITGDMPLAIARDGDMVISMGSSFELVRTTPAEREIIPDEMLGEGFVMASDDGDTILASLIYETFGPVIWRAGTGVENAPIPPGFVAYVTEVWPLALSGDGRVFSAQWYNQPQGHGLTEKGAYIASSDGSALTLTGDFSALAFNFDGSIAGGYRTTATSTVAAVRVGGQVVDLPAPANTIRTRITSISEDGSVALGKGTHATMGEEISFVWKNGQAFTLNDYLHMNRVNFSGVELKPDYPFRGRGVGSDGKTFAFHATTLNEEHAGSPYLARQFVVRIPTPCPADLLLDRMVDDADFVLFIASYDNFLCPETVPASCWADFNHDNYVDDHDFVIFVAAYDEMLCA